MNRILHRTPNLLSLKRKNSLFKLQSDPFGILKGIFATTGVVIVGHILLLKSTYSSYISEDHGRYLVLGRELKDDEKIEKRKILVDSFLEIWSNGIVPFIRWIFQARPLIGQPISKLLFSVIFILLLNMIWFLGSIFIELKNHHL